MTMNDNILKNLEYFSEVTQRTLSAFHVSGTDDSLVEEMESIRRFITNARTKKLVSIEREGNKFKRYFTDGSSDLVDFENISEPTYYEDDKFDFSIIENAMKQTISPISTLKVGNNIELVKDKKIERASEIIFFM